MTDQSTDSYAKTLADVLGKVYSVDDHQQDCNSASKQVAGIRRSGESARSRPWIDTGAGRDGMAQHDPARPRPEPWLDTP